MEVRFTISKSFIYCVVAAAFLALACVCMSQSVEISRLKHLSHRQTVRIQELEGKNRLDVEETHLYKPLERKFDTALQRLN